MSPCFPSLRWEGTKEDVSTCLDRWGESLCWDQPCSPSGAYKEYFYSKSKDVILNMISQGCFSPGICFPRWAVINTLHSFTKVFGRYKYLGSFITSLLKQNPRLILVTSQLFSAFDCFQDYTPDSIDVSRLANSSLKVADCLSLVPATNNSSSAVPSTTCTETSNRLCYWKKIGKKSG